MTDRNPQDRFDRFAQRYVTSQGHAQGSDLDILVAVAAPQPEWIALDIATGGGHTALRLAPHVTRVVATDLAPGMLAAADTHLRAQGADNVTFELADAQDLPFETEQFDLVTCRIAPHHFPDCPQFVREATRVLRSGGTLVVQDHVLPTDETAARYIDAFERLRDPSHNRAYSQDEWTEMFLDAGLQVTHTEQVTKEHSFLPWAERQDCTSETIDELVAMIQNAPPAARDWMQPHGFGTPEATFINRHLIIAGHKQA